MAQWIGFMVSIKCKEELGTFQGEICSATNFLITLTKSFHNGIPCPQNEIKIRADDILDIKLIEKQATSPQQRSTITIAKPIAKRAGRLQSTSEYTNTNYKFINGSHNNNNNNNNKSKPIDIELKVNGNGNSHNGNSFNGHNGNSYNDNNCYKNGTPNKKEKNGQRGKWTKGWKDEECFGSPLDEKISQDFDFEKNLALFNKQAIWDKLNNAQKPDLVKHAEAKRHAKYRCDENIIAAVPATYRQITVPKQEFCEYVTDDGLIIPSITRALRKRIWDSADKVGLTWDKRVEIVGRAATELTIQLVGGAHRLNLRNSHQLPTVVVLCGPNKQGAMGVNTARQLASHGVNTIVYAVSTEIAIVKKELASYTMTRNVLTNQIADLPTYADLIIVSLCDADTDNPKSYPELAEWTRNNRATILALDPPSVGTPGISPKFSMIPVLPLPHGPKNGKLYLCNLGIPVEIFTDVGIKYKSPFGPKFFIPLYPKEA